MLSFLFRYGYLTNTKVKFIVVLTDLDVRDADVRNVSPSDIAAIVLWSEIAYRKLITNLLSCVTYVLNVSV